MDTRDDHSTDVFEQIFPSEQNLDEIHDVLSPVSETVEKLERSPEIEGWKLEREGYQDFTDGESPLRDWLVTGIMEGIQMVEPEENDPEVWMPGTDFDGPVKSAGGQYAPFLDEIWRYFWQYEDAFGPSIVSNRSTPYLEHEAEKLGLPLDRTLLAGEGGRTYKGLDEEGRDEAEIKMTYGGSYREMGKTNFLRALFEEAAFEGYKLVMADKSSNEMGTVSVEGEGINLEEERTGIHHDEYYSKEFEKYGVDEIWRKIRRVTEDLDIGTSFERRRDSIIFDNTFNDVQVLRYALGENIWSARFDKVNDRIALWTDPTAYESFTIEDSRAFVDRAVQGTPYQAVHHDDWWTDYVVEDFSKEEAVESLAGNFPLLSDESGLVKTYMGDRPEDVFEDDAAVFYAQVGTLAQDYCEENNVPYIEANTAADKLLMDLGLMEYFNRG